jgi:SAM-dependent methyltransferase
MRKAVYIHYGRDFQDANDTFDATTAERWGKAYKWYFRRWLPQWKDAAIVDLGCGNGKLLHFFKQNGYTNLSGVDISPDQVALAREVVRDVQQSNALGWLADRQESFDLVIALDLIEHFRRDEALRFLGLCLSSLKPGGRLILQTPNADSPFGSGGRYNDITHEWAFNVNQLARLMRRTGFVHIEPREQGPVPWGYSLASTARWCAWRIVRAGLQFWNLAETGAKLPALTRVFLISGVKAAE